MIRVRYLSVTASCTVLLRLTEPSAAAAVVLCQPVWLELGTQEVPRRGNFQRIPRIPKGITKGITDQTNHRALFSDSMVATYTGTSLTPRPFSVFSLAWC